MVPITRGNSLYTIVDGPTWSQAEQNAVAQGGHLVTINDSSENEYLGKTFGNRANFYQSYTPGWDLWDFNVFWIGLTDKKTEGKWEWISQDSGSYRNWMPGAPSNPDGASENGTRDPNGYDYANIVWGLTQSYPIEFGKWIGGIPNDPKNIPPYTPWDRVQYKGLAEIPFVQRGDSAYVIVEGPTWEQAEANAVKLGGHLVTINDASENSWI